METSYNIQPAEHNPQQSTILNDTMILTTNSPKNSLVIAWKEKVNFLEKDREWIEQTRNNMEKSKRVIDTEMAKIRAKRDAMLLNPTQQPDEAHDSHDNMFWDILYSQRLREIADQLSKCERQLVDNRCEMERLRANIEGHH